MQPRQSSMGLSLLKGLPNTGRWMGLPYATQRGLCMQEFCMCLGADMGLWIRANNSLHAISAFNCIDISCYFTLQTVWCLHGKYVVNEDLFLPWNTKQWTIQVLSDLSFFFFLDVANSIIQCLRQFCPPPLLFLVYEARDILFTANVWVFFKKSKRQKPWKCNIKERNGALNGV